MSDRRHLRHGIVCGLSLLLLSCTAVPSAPVAPSPFPSLGFVAPAEKARLVQARIAGVETLTAVLAVAYTLGQQRGTFDMVVNYAATPAVRFTAVRDTFLTTQGLFDVLLTQETYRVLRRDATGEHLHQGPIGALTSAYPAFRTFFIVGAAFFLPGMTAPGQALTFNTAGTQAHSTLRSGVRVCWRTRPDTLEITQGGFTWQDVEGSVAVQVQYQDYRQVAGVYLPHRVTIRDRGQGFTASSVVKSLAVNEPLVPGVFDGSS